MADGGHDVVLGSRDEIRAAKVVASLRERWGGRVASLEPGTNRAAAAEPVVFLGTVWDAAARTAGDLAGQLDGTVVVSVANALERTGGHEFRAVPPPEGSVAAAVAAAAPRARVVAALQHVPATVLGDLDHDASCDVLVAGDDDDARATIIGLVDAIPGMHGLDAGGLANATGIEAFSAAMLTVNLRHTGESTLHLGGVGVPR
jgi:hypothetical protein